MFTERYHVRVAKDFFTFSCAHFITFNGNMGERLHGHNYRVAVEVHGPLDENHYVFDFIGLQNLTRAIAGELDHHMLLATKNPLLPVTADDHRVRVTFGSKEWIFPREDCILLDIGNTTAELLAKLIAERLLEGVRSRDYSPEAVRVEVEENVGQSAVIELRP